jgi:hypothetical protein
MDQAHGPRNRWIALRLLLVLAVGAALGVVGKEVFDRSGPAETWYLVVVLRGGAHRVDLGEFPTRESLQGHLDSYRSMLELPDDAHYYMPRFQPGCRRGLDRPMGRPGFSTHEGSTVSIHRAAENGDLVQVSSVEALGQTTRVSEPMTLDLAWRQLGEELWKEFVRAKGTWEMMGTVPVKARLLSDR